MPIRVNDLKDALEKLNEPQAALEKMDQLNGKWLGERLGSVANDVTARSNLINQGILNIANSVAEQQAQLKTAMASRDVPALTLSTIAFKAAMASIADSGLGKMFEDLERRKREALAYYRPLAYALIKSEHLEHAIARIDWEAFMAAQRPSLTEQEEAAGDPSWAAVVAERSQLAAALDSRLKERAIQEQAATELLAYAWGSRGGMWEDAAISDMLEEFLPDAESWAALSRQVLEPEYLHKILDAPGRMPIMAPAFRDNWGDLPSIALVRGALRHFMSPWEGDRRYWPEARFDWAGTSPGHVVFTLHESPSGGTPAQIQAAWDHVDSINEWVRVTFATIATIYQRNKQHGGRLVIETNDILKAWGKGTAKGFKAADKDRVNTALFTLSQIVVQRLEYTYRPQGKRSKVSESVRTEHLIFLDQLGSNGRNITWSIHLGAPFLQMARDFPLQYADIAEGSIGPDGNEPYRARFDLDIPVEARARPAVFTQHGVTVREILELLGIDPATIDPRKRTYWRNYLPKLLNSSLCLREWQFVEKPSDVWPQWLEARLILHVKRKPGRKGDDAATEDLEEQTVRIPQPTKIASGWVTSAG
jgi:hypothetical protein